MIGQTISRYKILVKLGEGGMSQIFPRTCLTGVPAAGMDGGTRFSHSERVPMFF